MLRSDDAPSIRLRCDAGVDIIVSQSWCLEIEMVRQLYRTGIF